MTAITEARTFAVSHLARPFTVNDALRMHRQQCARLTAEWRRAFWALTLEARVPKLDRVAITVETHLKGQRRQDPAACCIAVKAAIDGIVDAGVLVDDDGEHLVSLTFLPPIFGTAVDELTLVVTEVIERASSGPLSMEGTGT